MKWFYPTRQRSYLEEFFHVGGRHPWLLPDGLLSEGALEALSLEQVDPSVLRRLVQERHRQTSLPHDHLVRVFHGRLHLFLELLQRVLSDDLRIAEPGSAGFESGPGAGVDVGLKRCRSDDLSVGIALGLGAAVHLKPLDGSGSSRLRHPLGDVSGFAVRVHAVVAAPLLVVRNLRLHFVRLHSFRHFEEQRFPTKKEKK